MAIDSAAKRASVLGFQQIWNYIIPDATLAQADMQTILGFYGGIAAGALVAVVYHWNSPFTRAYG